MADPGGLKREKRHLSEAPRPQGGASLGDTGDTVDLVE